MWKTLTTIIVSLIYNTVYQYCTLCVIKTLFITLLVTIRSENVLKRLSMRIINRLSVYSHQSDTLSRRGSTRNTATLTRQLPAPSPSPSAKVSSTMSPKLITNYFSFVDSPDCPESPSQHSYENTPMTSSSVAITSNSTTSSDSTTIPVITIVHHKRDDSEVYCVPETNDMDNRPYSQLHVSSIVFAN